MSAVLAIDTESVVSGKKRCQSCAKCFACCNCRDCLVFEAVKPECCRRQISHQIGRYTRANAANREMGLAMLQQPGNTIALVANYFDIQEHTVRCWVRWGKVKAYRKTQKPRDFEFFPIRRAAATRSTQE